MERKTFPAQVTETDGDQGIVDAVFAVFGNIDDGNDVVHPGAFAKTFVERGRDVKVLDQHRTDSIERVLGMPVELREMGREELPADLQMKYPEAKGGAFARVQFLMETPQGKGAFVRLKAGAINEWSFGYDVLDADFSKAQRDGNEITVRNLRTLKLYEISPVLWGMNPATATTAAKDGGPEEGKPWRVVPQGEQFCVYKLDAEGEPDGEPLKCYDTAAEAREYMRALYANVEDEEMAGDGAAEEKAITDTDKNVINRELRALNMTDLVANHRRLHQMAARGAMLTGFSRADMNWYHAAAEAELRRRAEDEDREPPEATPLEWGKAEGEGPETVEGEDDKHMVSRVAVIARREREKGAKVGRILAQRNADRLGQAFAIIADVFEDAGVSIPGFNRLIEEIEEESEDEGKGQQAGPQAEETPTPNDGAGPSTQAPTDAEKALAIIELRKRELELLEV